MINSHNDIIYFTKDYMLHSFYSILGSLKAYFLHSLAPHALINVQKLVSDLLLQSSMNSKSRESNVYVVSPASRLVNISLQFSSSFDQATAPSQYLTLQLVFSCSEQPWVSILQMVAPP